MRSKVIPYLIALSALIVPQAPCATTFGSVVAIGGQASDLALDEARGFLYIANYTANRIDKLKIGSTAIQSSISVSPQPGSLALSPDGQYLVVTHGPQGSRLPASYNRVTVIHLADMATQVFSTGDQSPLAVTFISTVPATGPSNLAGPGMAVIATTNGLYTLDPRNGVMAIVSTFANMALNLPVPIPTFPPQILQTALNTSASGTTVWGVASTGQQPELVYVFDGRTNTLSTTSIVAAPPILPRVSVSSDGSSAMVGYALF